MNKIVKILLLLTLPMFMVAQTGPAAPSSGIWALIDTSYTVGTTTQGVTKARLTLKNTTATKITGESTMSTLAYSAYSILTDHAWQRTMGELSLTLSSLLLLMRL